MIDSSQKLLTSIVVTIDFSQLFLAGIYGISTIFISREQSVSLKLRKELLKQTFLANAAGPMGLIGARA